MDFSNKTYNELMVMLGNITNALNDPESAQHRIDRALFLKDKVFQEFSIRTNELRDNRHCPVMAADGVLSAFNYRVGDNGITSAEERLVILKLIIESPIPPINNIEYVEKWGEPCTPKRLRTLQRTISGLIHNRRRNGRQFRYRRAIGHWENDLRTIENLPIQSLAA